MDFIVGTFNTSQLFTLRFTLPSAEVPASLRIFHVSSAIGKHSWLSLSRVRSNQTKTLYATAWTEPPSLAAYAIDDDRNIQYLNSKEIRSRSGYVCASNTHLYSSGGSTGEAFALSEDGSIGELVQELSFASDSEAKPSSNLHGDFGGLRSGAHSVDLSPDGRSLYVADIGRNCIWTYSIDDTSSRESSDRPHLTLASKHISPRHNDGPRHTTPHPSGKILYSLQEHSSMVDLFAVADEGVALTHLTGVNIIPEDKDPKDYWADEVRVSTTVPGSQDTPKYMYASTRGLKAETKGYVAVFVLRSDGTLAHERALCIWQTPTSGGIANAIEPAPRSGGDEVEYLALTDSEEGLVMVLSFDGGVVKEVARVALGKTDDGQVIQAATAVWL
ncbi:hypothetical protein B0A48_05227 [Cryoendolithus antarcticus]|uniref:Muconate cycloisomerase 1 n=1 Tax=Cryoendolithus antarcticus TaxID=1507870 RepID=A0A1V8TIB6_9PEZI|nr:hypothetical protein B0A48_05227 [Cryoendolithus antarcticus]